MTLRAILSNMKPLTDGHFPVKGRKVFFVMLIGILAINSWHHVLAQEPLNWVVDELYPDHDLVLKPDPVFFTEGTRSCSVQLTSDRVPYLTSGEFTVSAGSSYQFSADAFDNDTLGQLKVYADFYDSSGFLVLGGDPVFTADSSEWQTISWEGAVPENAVRGFVRFKFFCQPDPGHFIDTALAWIDRIVFREGEGPNKVLNGGFEEWTTGIVPFPVGNEKITVAPNPCQDVVFVNSDNDFTGIWLSGTMGNAVMKRSFPASRSIQLDLGDLPRGLYVLIVLTSNEGKAAFKLVIL